MNLFKPLTNSQAVLHFDRYFHKLKAKNPGRPLDVLISSEKTGLDYRFPSDSTCQPYHIASVGKLFTAALVLMLSERGQLSIDDPIHKYLSPGILQGLFIYQGSDYSQQVTIRHLLGHTAGIADYFEDPTASGIPFTQGIIENPGVHWTPQALIDFTRQQQKAVGRPGERFHYSDSGYILLGMIIEHVSGKSFDKNLEDEFFRPLEMRDSSLMFYSQPANQPKKELQPTWFNGVEISRFESLSCDWSGGGILSTSEDLLKFNRAQHSGRLIQPGTLAEMQRCSNRFRPGIYYGLGMMEIRFKEFFFLLGRLPKIKGHIGILATHLYYDAASGAHIILNFGSTDRMEESFRALIEIETVLQRM